MLRATVPRLQTDQKQAFAWPDPGVRVPARWPTFGSWIGGDREGNPNVTAAVTPVARGLNRRRGARKVRLAARELACTLTVGDRRDTVVPALEKELRVNLHGSRHIGELGKRYPLEPDRLLLGVLRERLMQGVGEGRAGRVLAAEAGAGTCLDVAAVADRRKTENLVGCARVVA